MSLSIRTFSLSAVLLSSFAHFSCNRTQGHEPVPPPLVRVITVQSEGDPNLELRGILAPRERLRLGFKLPGVIASIRVREGDTVRVGQCLANLDEVDARSQERAARAVWNRAARDAERAERLVAEGAMASSQREDSRTVLESAEAAHVQARDALTRTRLLAPLSGTVFQRLAEPGETVTAGTPVLVIDAGSLIVKLSVTDRERSRLKIEQPVVLIPEDGGENVPGRVSSLGNAPGPDGLYGIEITPAKLFGRPGVLAKVRLGHAQGSAAGLRVPFSALVHRNGQDLVFVVEGNPFKVTARPVKVSHSDGLGVVLREGARSGERVATEGAFFLQDGEPIRIAE